RNGEEQSKTGRSRESREVACQGEQGSEGGGGFRAQDGPVESEREEAGGEGQARRRSGEEGGQGRCAAQARRPTRGEGRREEGRREEGRGEPGRLGEDRDQESGRTAGQGRQAGGEAQGAGRTAGPAETVHTQSRSTRKIRDYQQARFGYRVQGRQGPRDAAR